MKVGTDNSCTVWRSAFTRLGRRAAGEPPEGGTPNKAITAAPPCVRAFSLIEVMIAIAIFFMCSFVILALISSGLRTARMLRTTRPNAGMLAAEMTLTNQLEEGMESGDFGKMYREYTWTKETAEAGTNGLWQVDFAIYKRGQGHVPDSTMSILLYSPGSKTKRLGVQP